MRFLLTRLLIHCCLNGNPNDDDSYDDDDVAGDDVNATEQSGLKSTRQGATIRPRPRVLHCSYSYILVSYTVATAMSSCTSLQLQPRPHMLQ